VIGFHRAGVPRAVATCGTALTEQHVQVLKRFASKVVLAFDADNAGQGAAERFYEWETKYQVQVLVARFPPGKDPGELSVSQPELLAEAVKTATPFLGFRLERLLPISAANRSPDERGRLAQAAMAAINEHPDLNTRRIYAGEVANRLNIPAGDLIRLAEQRSRTPTVRVVTPERRVPENGEFAALAMLIQRWDDIAPWLTEDLFADEVSRRAFLALADGHGDVTAAIDIADGEAREVLERAAVADLDVDPEVEALNLIAAAVRRELRQRVRITDAEALREVAEARLQLEKLQTDRSPQHAAEWLLGWLHRRSEERS
jgi:DNA primase